MVKKFELNFELKFEKKNLKIFFFGPNIHPSLYNGGGGGGGVGG